MEIILVDDSMVSFLYPGIGRKRYIYLRNSSRFYPYCPEGTKTAFLELLELVYGKHSLGG